MIKKIIFKKFILGIFVSLFILPFFIKPVSAFETPNPTYQFQFEEAISSQEMNLQSFVNETLKAIMGSFVHFIIGTINPDCNLNDKDANNCLVEGKGQFYGLVPTGVILFSGLYQYQPASGIQYFADLGRNLGIIKPIYAQTDQFSAFEAFRALQPIWTTFRNISYVLLVLILIGMGFAIMFRVKISPQAVITIQSALPRIVIALILITFSYAIVGLILDVSLFVNSFLSSLFVNLFKSEFPGGWIFNFYNKVFAPWTLTAPDALKSVIKPFIDAQAYGLTATVGFFVAAAGIPIFSILILLIVGILVAIAYLKALWVLIRALAMIIINLIFAPFRILIGVLPGNNGMVDWFKDIIANVAILPGMLAIYFIGNYLILKGIATPIKMAAGGLGGFLTYGVFWMLTGFLLPIIGIFILLLIPKVADIIQSFITKKPFQYGTAIGEAMKMGVAPFAYPARIIKGGIEKQTSEEVAGILVPKIRGIGQRLLNRPKTGSGGDTVESTQAVGGEETSV